MQQPHKHIALTLGTAVLLFAGGAGADSQLTKDQVKAKLEAAGYKEVSDIRRAYDHYDAVARKEGKRVAVDVDPQTGAIKPDPEESQNLDQQHGQHGRDDY